MGRIVLVGRLAVRDLKGRRVETALLLLAVLAATTTLTLGLVLRDAASDPFQSTRVATDGPDVLASADTSGGLSELEALADHPDVVEHSGPYPATGAELQVSGRTSDVQAIGRDTTEAEVDQPAVVQGTWLRDGGVVVEAAFAEAFDVHVGDPVIVDERSFTVVGLAVSAATPPYPGASCIVPPGCVSGASPEVLAEVPPDLLRDPGLVWLTRADVRTLTTDPAYVMNLQLADPDHARAFAEAYVAEQPVRPTGATGAPGLRLESWNDILAGATEVAGDSQIVLMIGAWLLGLLGVASLSVLVGGRMADQTRRVGLLKAVGGTPKLVALVLLTEYLVVALVAAAAGLLIGALTAPLLTAPSAGLIGDAGTPSLTPTTVLAVTAVALAVAALATILPAVRAARVSTIDALADAARPPRRTGWLIRASARLPVPLLLALRVAGRRPRRAVLAVASIAITISGIFVVLILDAFLSDPSASVGYDEAQLGALRRVLLVWVVILLLLTAVNAIVITWTTVLENRHASALARALGATPGEVGSALSTAQVVPAVVGAVVGIFPCGHLLFAALMAITGGDPDRATMPSLWQLVALVLATGLVVWALTALPARLGGRRPVAEAL